MMRFAADILAAMKVVTRDLEVMLGPDTSGTSSLLLEQVEMSKFSYSHTLSICRRVQILILELGFIRGKSLPVYCGVRGLVSNCTSIRCRWDGVDTALAFAI